MERHERPGDTYYRENIVNPDAYGRGTRTTRDLRAAAKAQAVRLVCTPCGKRIDALGGDDHIKLAYRPDPHRSTFDENGAMVLAPSKTWRCKCGRPYPITLERMRIEYRAALDRDRVIALPLPKL